MNQPFCQYIKWKFLSSLNYVVLYIYFTSEKIDPLQISPHVLRSTDKQLRIMSGASHHLLLEFRHVRHEVMSGTVAWLLARVKTAAE